MQKTSFPNEIKKHAVEYCCSEANMEWLSVSARLGSQEPFRCKCTLGSVAQSAAPSTIWSTELRTHTLQELNDGFLVLFCSAVQALQPELQLSPRVFEHACVPKNLWAVEPCKGQNGSYFFCAAAHVSNQRTRVQVPALLPGWKPTAEDRAEITPSPTGDNMVPFSLLCTPFPALVLGKENDPGGSEARFYLDFHKDPISMCDSTLSMGALQV